MSAKPPVKSRKVCKFCMMMRFMMVFMAVVALFILNGLYNFWS